MKSIIFILIPFCLKLFSFDTILHKQIQGSSHSIIIKNSKNIDDILKVKNFNYIKKFLKNNPLYMIKIYTNRQTLMHKAVVYHRYKLISYLVDNNIAVYTQDSNGNTPVHLAFYNNDIKAIGILMKSKSFSKSLYIKNYLYVSPLELSKKGSSSIIKNIFDPDLYIDLELYK